MRVLIFSNEYPPRGGGTGVVAQQFANGLSTQLGYKVEVLTSKFKNIERNSDVVVIHEIELVKKLWFYSYSKFDFSSYDLIILNDPISIVTAGMFFNKDLLSKSICMLHGSEPEYTLDDKSLGKILFNVKYFFRKAILGSKVTLAHSKYMKEKICSRSYYSSCRDKIMPFYFGFDDNIFNIDSKPYDYIGKHNLPEQAKILLTVSRLDIGKGYIEMLDLFESVTKCRPDFYWFIAGDGPYFEDFSTLIKEKGLNHRIHLLGKVERQKLSSFYVSADVFLLLSNYKESFGLVYTEAQCCGTATIGRNTYGVVEAIEHGVSGFLVDDNSTTAKIIINEDYNNLRKVDIVNNAKRFSLSEVIRKFESLL